MPTTRQWEIQNSMFRTPVHLYRNDQGNKNYFELAESSSYRG